MAVKLCLVLLVCALVAAAPVAESAVTCGQVTKNLGQCINYLRGKTNGNDPPPQCCSGVASMNNAAATTPDRQATCNCIKKAAAQISGLDDNLVSGLPAKCKVNIPYKISRSTDCNSVK